MNDELFQQLAASLREGGAILRGTEKPARSTELPAPDARAIREKLGMNQTQFAALVGISARTLQNWEQGTAGPKALRVPSSGWRNVILKLCSMPCTGESGSQRL
jgi:putative transcriptional regulator